MHHSLNIPALILGALTAGAFARPLILPETSDPCLSTPGRLCGLQSGTYQIVNSATSTLLRSGGPSDPIFVTYADENADPGPYGLWNVESAGSRTFTISNVGLDRPVALNYKGEIGIGDVHPVLLTIIAAGENLFNIGVAQEDRFWTVDSSPEVSTVSLESESHGQETLWQFKRIAAPHGCPETIGHASQAHFQVE
ncbi:hypothetical protein MSAN_01086500 [Mycena sanguinolenta]|uniref:Uncharacterized protein n=1 Tax=Mycena sanguinolenta TaxID=230812 RepID=A0A8H6YSV9_9AGAR|nr:hypothetical protein MSAN_01086500 [Mycena sanguinolenta]